MLSVIITLFVLTGVSVAAGLPVARLLGLPAERVPLPLIMLLGLIATGLYVQVAYTLLPLNLYAWLIFILLLLISHRLLKTAHLLLSTVIRLRLAFKQAATGTTVLLISLAICGIINLMMRPGAFDAGSYHLQAIKWAEHYRVVPGLVNISCQFGFNSSWYLLNAFAGLSYAGIPSVYPVNLFLLLLYISYLLMPRSATTIAESGNLLHLYRLLNVVFCLPFIFSKYAGEVSADFPVILLTCWTALLFLEQTMQTGQTTSQPISSQQVLLFLIPVFLLSIKISSMPVCLFAALQLPYIFKHRLKPALILVSITLLPWLYNNIMLSGYVLFPLPFTNLHLDWSHPTELAKVVNERINGWARSPYVDSHLIYQMPFPQWVGVWFAGLKLFNVLLMVACASGLMAIVLLRKQIRLQLELHLRKQAILLCCLLISGILFWFFTAPDFRFAYGYFLPLMAILVSMLLQSAAPGISSKLTTNSTKVLVFFAPVLLVVLAGMVRKKNAPWQVSNLIHPLPYRANYMEQIPLKSVTLTHASAEEKCWDLYFPCTCEWYPGLEARGNNVMDGFRINPSIDLVFSTQPDK